MSKICPEYFSLSKVFSYWTKICQKFVQVLSIKFWGLVTELLVQFLSRFCPCPNLVFYNINVCSWFFSILPLFLSLRFYLILSAPQIIDDSSNRLLTYSHNSHRHATAWHCYLSFTWFLTFWLFVSVLMVYMWTVHVINL